jgi:hypothetical protein
MYYGVIFDLSFFLLSLGLSAFHIRLCGSTFLSRLLLTGEVRIQEHHTVIHNLEVLTQQAEVTVKLPKKSVYVANIDLNYK